MSAPNRRRNGTDMAVFFDLLPLQARSRMTGVWTSRVSDYGHHPLHMSGHFIALGAGQDADVEWDFLGSHLPFHVGGVTGVGPDGRPWVFITQVAPDQGDPDAALDCMTDAVLRAIEFNGEASLRAKVSLTREELVAAYVDNFVDEDDLADWSVPELVFGLLAECCRVELVQIVEGRIAQCAFPDDQHECTHDVFTDVFARWITGELTLDESAFDEDEDDEEDDEDDEDDDPRFTRQELLAYSVSELKALLKEVGFQAEIIDECNNDLDALTDVMLSVYVADDENAIEEEQWATRWLEDPRSLRPARKRARLRRPSRKSLRKVKTSRLRLMAVADGWTVDAAETAKRKPLIKALAAPKH